MASQRSTSRRDWTFFGTGIALASAILTGWQAFEAYSANRKSGDQISVTIERNAWYEGVALNTGFVSVGAPALLESRWFVEIYNLSSTPITIKSVYAYGYNEEQPVPMISVDSARKGAPEIEPFSIPAGDHKRFELKISVPIPEAMTKIVLGCKCDNYHSYQEYMRSNGFDEIGNFTRFNNYGLPIGFDHQHPPKNAAALVRVETASGNSYIAKGKWHPGLDLPKHPLH
jgi:hypothetical protein